MVDPENRTGAQPGRGQEPGDLPGEAGVSDVHTGLSPAAIRRSGQAIAATQLPSGAIPWFPGGQTDPWDHIEAAMGLDVAEHHDEARAAYEWLRKSQNPDGSWFRAYCGSTVVDASA